jgi:uncharacterized membrane protein YdjX (TVP38/TMEM64 family)
MEHIIGDLISMLKEVSMREPLFLSMSFGFLLIVLESILPVLPLALFIALNMILFGNLFGFLLSWVATICGCILSYSICRYGFSDKFYKYLKKHPKTDTVVLKIKKITFSNLVILMAIPFTPAFSINIGAGLSKMEFKKFFFALLISKLSIVYFWGFVGTTLLESLTDITVLVKLAFIVVVAFVLSKIVLKKFHFE